MSALVPATNPNQWSSTSIPIRQFVHDSPTVPNLRNVTRLQFECVTGTAAGTTGFDEVVIASTLDVPVLDTLYYAQAPAVLTRVRNNDSDPGDYKVVMTYYHGHDSQPFIFSGFSLWTFKRTQLQQLVDFVMQRLWGLQKTSGTAFGVRAAGPDRARLSGSAAALGTRAGVARRMAVPAATRRVWPAPSSRR